MLDSCELLGSTWDALRTGILAVAVVGAVILFSRKTRPAGFGALALGILWIAFGIWFAHGLHAGNESARDMAQANAKLLGKMIATQAVDPRGSGEDKLRRLIELNDPERRAECLRSYVDASTTFYIPVVLTVLTGIGVAFLATWLISHDQSKYREGHTYIGATNSGHLYKLTYKGVHWFSGRERWHSELECEPAGKKWVEAEDGDLPHGITYVTSAAELRFHQLTSGGAIVLDKLGDCFRLPQPVRRTV